MSRIKLTKPQIARLREISRDRFNSFGCMPATTRALFEAGFVDKCGGKVAKTGRIVWHPYAVINDAGRAALAEAEARP